MNKVRGCRGRAVSGKIAGQVTDQALYAILAKKLPQEILAKYPNWNKGRPGSKTMKLVAHFQMHHFKGDLKEVDGCVGSGTWAALNS
jgi:hypothetical protein